MKYFKIPNVNGVLDIDYIDLLEGITISVTEAVVSLRDETEQRETWEIITEEEFNQYKPEAPTSSSTPTTMEELKENQLILMGAIADLYNDFMGVS
jgi:hypothetical protein